jgi:hypothetical protein
MHDRAAEKAGKLASRAYSGDYSEIDTRLLEAFVNV